MTASEDDNWPRHTDGRRKKVGEMNPEERRSVFKTACDRLGKEFADPRVQAGITRILNEPL